ncbi:MAG: hypothetical protein NT140_09205 [Deltaproteobacteria bacterium]|nr:hypothetical protein [Deltaproteobacteria bacterium]
MPYSVFSLPRHSVGGGHGHRLHTDRTRATMTGDQGLGRARALCLCTRRSVYVVAPVDLQYLADHITLPDLRHEIRIKNNGK